MELIGVVKITASKQCRLFPLFVFSFLLLLDWSYAINSLKASGGGCGPGTGVLRRHYPPHTIRIPLDHFHHETRYAPHSDAYFSNRFWYDDTYYQPGGPVIVQNKGEDLSSAQIADLQDGLLRELTRATSGLAVLLEHRYYSNDPPVRIQTVKDFRFLSVEQAMADQAYFARNVVFPGKEDLNLTTPNTPWFAIGGSYPGALTAFERIQYPDLFWGAIASSAVTALRENYWEYFDAVRIYSPPDCVSIFGKLINITDSILLGGNHTEITQLKGLFRYASTNGSNADFANEFLNFPFSLQSKNWGLCPQEEYEYLKGCRILTWPEALYPKTEKQEQTVKAIVDQSQWANETESLATSFLNYIGFTNGDRKENTTTKTSTQISGSLNDPSSNLGPGAQYLAWTYQQCTEIGLFLTGDAPKSDTLPVISSLITLHYLRNMFCRDQLGLNLTEISGISHSLEAYGGFNISYPRLMFTGGEVDPWRPATQLAARNTPTRLNYTSTPEQPWFLIPGGSHIWDLEGVFPNQTSTGIPEGITVVHRLEKEAIVRWLEEWRPLHPDYDVYAK